LKEGPKLDERPMNGCRDAGSQGLTFIPHSREFHPADPGVS
jgi:hypothetical protein